MKNTHLMDSLTILPCILTLLPCILSLRIPRLCDSCLSVHIQKMTTIHSFLTWAPTCWRWKYMPTASCAKCKKLYEKALSTICWCVVTIAMLALGATEEHLSRRLQCFQNREHAKQFLDILQQDTAWLRLMVIARCADSVMPLAKACLGSDFIFWILECLLRSNLSKRSKKHKIPKTPSSQMEMNGA